jgi:hypothetical protein
MSTAALFEKKAKDLLQRFDAERGRKQPLQRPFMIELFGTPKAGKTTVKEMLKHFFKRQGWSVAAPTEGAEVVEWVKRLEPDYNFQTGEYALGRARELAYGPAHKSFHVAIFDRAIYDVIARMEYYLAKGILTEAQRNVIEDYFLLPQNAGLFDCHICMIADAEVSIERELARALTKKHGETMNPQTLRDLYAAHISVWDRLDCRHRGMGLIDSSKEREDQTARRVLSIVLETFARRLRLAG